MAVSEQVATAAVHAAAEKFWELERARLAEAGAPAGLPEFNELPKVKQMEVKTLVLPIVWAALETVPALPEMRPEWGRRTASGLLKGHVSSIFGSAKEALENMHDNQELVVRDTTAWQAV